MNRVKLDNLGGLRFNQDILAFLQAAGSDALGALAALSGPLVIVTGCAVSGSTNANGWVAINGELLPFEGGTITGTVGIIETVTQKPYEDDVERDVLIARKAANVVSGAYNWADFKRLPTLNQMAPPGIVQPYAGAAAPSGWLICDGSAVSRATYAELFGVIAETYGAGNGTTTFNLPNLKGKVPVGFDASQTEFDGLGETGGEKTHELTDGEINHRHQVSGVGTANSYSMASDFESTGGGGSGYFRSNVDTTWLTGTSGRASTSLLQPYITMPYIIKY